MPHTVIVENDESQWHDQTGSLFHFPSRYRKFLQPGTKLLYYKGKQTKSLYAAKRLSAAPHYFGIAEAGKAWKDPKSRKRDWFIEVLGYRPFTAAVLAKQGKAFIEKIPPNRVTNYWRDGARPVDEATYLKVMSQASLLPEQPANDLNDANQGSQEAFESAEEGQEKKRYVTQYERDPSLRKAAIALHGVVCVVCGFNFGQFYGEIGEGFTHVHHLRPIYEFEGPSQVNPASDLVPVCANCHAIIHRKRKTTLTVENLKARVHQQKTKQDATA
jgi:putative restriction endonuclease